MAVDGFVLITVCLANVLAAQAEFCNCDCKAAPNLHQPQHYYIPAVPVHVGENHLGGGHQFYQHLGAVSVESIAHLAQAQSEYQNIGQYEVAERGTQESLETGSKIEHAGASLGDQNTNQHQQLHSSGTEGYTGTSQYHDATTGQQSQVSKVLTHQDTHYINIEQHSSPQEGHSDDDKGHHHGKNDYYKFEYGVNDQKTHDVKQHKEEKKGDVVRGEYSLVEDNGNVRTVKYYADWKTGFHAQVHNSKGTPLG